MEKFYFLNYFCNSDESLCYRVIVKGFIEIKVNLGSLKNLGSANLGDFSPKMQSWGFGRPVERKLYKSSLVKNMKCSFTNTQFSLF
jgi:hypothetical protein